MTARVLLFLAGMFGLLLVTPAWAFNYARYQAASLDELLDQKRPADGADVYRGELIKLSVTLTGYRTPCDASFLKKMLVVIGIAKDLRDQLRVTGCITVRSAKGRSLRLFIQDQVSMYLPKEVPIGSAVTLFAMHVYTTSDGPKLLVNEFHREP